MIAGRRTDRLAEREKLSGRPGFVAAVPAYVTVPERRQALIDATVDHSGRVDILVNNAGDATRAPLLDWSPSDWRDGLEVNLDAAFFMAQGVLPLMRERSFGRIVGISSIMGWTGGRRHTHAACHGRWSAAQCGRPPTTPPRRR